MLLVGSLGLFADDLVPGGGVLRRQRDQILLAKIRDGAGKDGLDAFAYPDLASNLRSYLGSFGFAQVLHALRQVRWANDVNHRRLLELYLQSLIQRGVE